RRRHDLGRHAAQDLVRARSRAQWRECGACGGRARRPLPAAGNPDRPRRRHHDQFALIAMRALRTVVASHRPARTMRATDTAGSAQTVWLFDLDNTLHDCSKGIFGAIDSAMAQAVATTLNIDMDAANVLRKTYWKRYGATVIGMARHHNVDANAFLE